MAEEKIEIEPVLESVLLYCLKDARERLEAGEVVVPFSALAVQDKLFMEEHAADTAAESFASARKTVSGARGAQAYGFCYDGFVDAEGFDGNLVKRDCLIAEGGVPGAEYGHAVGLIYKTDAEGNIKFNKEPIYISKALNYMLGLTDEEGDLELEEFTSAEDHTADQQDDVAEKDDVAE